MGSSSGATQAAFEQMDQGGAVAFEKLKAVSSTTMREVGKSLSVATEPIINALLPNLAKFAEWFSITGGPAIQEFATNAMAWISEFIERANPILDEFGAKWDQVIAPAMMMVSDAIQRIGEVLGITGGDVDVMSILLTGLKLTLDAVVIGVQLIGIAFQGIAWVFETVRDAVDMWKSLNDQITTMLGLIENGDFGFLSDAAGWMGDTRGLLGFDTGGVVPGATGSPQLVVAHGGETILPTHKGGAQGQGGNTFNISINAGDTAGGQRAANAFIDTLRARGMVIA